MNEDRTGGGLDLPSMGARVTCLCYMEQGTANSELSLASNEVITCWNYKESSKAQPAAGLP